MPSYPSSEYRVLQSLQKYCNFRPGSRYPLDIGDDGAVRRCRAGERLVITGDCCVEGVHFSLQYASLAEAGYRAMVSNISDCAAMGARPESALVQVVFPETGAKVEKKLRELYRGFNRACRAHGFSIIGGDLSRGPCWMVAVTMIGVLHTSGRPLSRQGARRGDLLWVSGAPGAAAAGLAALKRWGRRGVPARYRPLLGRHLMPQPPLACGIKLSRDPKVHAVIDISDGISKECRTLSHENGLVIELQAGAIPVSSLMADLAATVGANPLDWALHGGEDYELLFSASAGFDARSVSGICPVACIGIFLRKGSGVYIREGGVRRPVRRGGWDHLGRR